MSTPTQNGIYVAEPVGIGIEEKSTGSVQANVQFKLIEYRGANGMESEPCDFTFTAFMNLVTKKGKLNEINARSFRDALGWDGSSFASLSGMDFGGVKCQVVVDDDVDQNGTTKRIIKYINPIDYTPGAAVTSDPNVVQSLDAKYGAMLRATAGSKPSKPNGKASAKLAASKSTDTPVAVAYAKFISIVDQYGRETPTDVYSTAERSEVFKKLADQFAKLLGKSAKELTGAELANFTKEIEANYSPALRDFIPL
jgi:hypothetical protein